MTEQESEFKNLNDRLVLELIDADSKLELLYHLKSRTEDALDQLNLAPAFFGITMESLATDAIITISRFYDKDPRSQSIYHYLRFLLLLLPLIKIKL